MTTKIKIVNESDMMHPDSHIVQVEHAGTIYKIAPGYDYTLHVWQDMEVKITEVPKGEPRGYGAMAPDSKMYGMTPDQLMAHQALQDKKS